MNTIIVDALKVIGAPRHVNVRGKKITPTVMFSPALGESMLFWLATSISEKLHSQSLLNLNVVADSKSVSGSKIVSMDDSAALLNDGTLGIGLASSLLIIGEAADQIFTPARSDRNFDYGNLFFEFRECVLSKYRDGEKLPAQDYDLNTLLDRRVFKAARQHGQSIRNDIG